MLVKIILLFLLGMAAVAMIGRFRWPSGGRKIPPRAPPTICGQCGRLITGKGDCDCRRRKG